MSPNFFNEQSEQSAIKTEIVRKYFDAWTKVMTGAQKRSPYVTTDNKLGYVDLFAGPGRYNDGTISTALCILEKAIADPSLAQRLVTIFNDKDSNAALTLRTEIQKLPGISTLKYPPVVKNIEVGEEIVAMFSGETIPLLTFIDPWGYKGLSLDLVNAMLKSWGCDCIFFFNYNRINMGVNNPSVYTHMRALFGDDRALALRSELSGADPASREARIVEALAEALLDRTPGARFVLPFCFKTPNGTRTTHHLILVTKNFRGYNIMKSIMKNVSSSSDQGVPSFTYCPAAANADQGLLFSLNTPLTKLRTDLLSTFAGQTLTVEQIYVSHSVNRPFIACNYKAVLRELYEECVIGTDRPPKKGTFADSIVVTFP